MLNKGLFLACALALLSACDSSDKPTAPSAPAAASSVAPKPAKAAVDVAALKQRYAGRELSGGGRVRGAVGRRQHPVGEFSVPLARRQKFADKLHLVDSKSGKVDGAWELSDNLMELRLRHLEPQRKLVLTVDPGVRAVNDNLLPAEYVAQPGNP